MRVLSHLLQTPEVNSNLLPPQNVLMEAFLVLIVLMRVFVVLMFLVVFPIALKLLML